MASSSANLVPATGDQSKLNMDNVQSKLWGFRIRTQNEILLRVRQTLTSLNCIQPRDILYHTSYRNHQIIPDEGETEELQCIHWKIRSIHTRIRMYTYTKYSYRNDEKMHRSEYVSTVIHLLLVVLSSWSIYFGYGAFIIRNWNFLS